MVLLQVNHASGRSTCRTWGCSRWKGTGKTTPSTDRYHRSWAQTFPSLHHTWCLQLRWCSSSTLTHVQQKAVRVSQHRVTGVTSLWVLVPPNERVGGSVLIIFWVWTLSWNGGNLFLVSSPPSTPSGEAPVPPQGDSGEGRPLCFPHHTKELSRQLYSTLIIQATRQEILCMLSCWGCIINADIHQKDEGTLHLCEKFRCY